MGFIERTVWRLFNSPPKDPFLENSPKLLATPSQTNSLYFDLPSGASSSSSSTTSLSSSSTFWMSPGPSRWSIHQYLPRATRSVVSKRQIVVVLCIILGLAIWVTPPPRSWKHRVVHINVQEPVSNPYQVLRPASSTAPKKHSPDPEQWLQRNANNKYAETGRANLWSSIPVLGQANKKPKAALISLVRNSELPGLMQSMQQLEFQWNRKYNYPWVFFNDEAFSDEFKVDTVTQSQGHI